LIKLFSIIRGKPDLSSGQFCVVRRLHKKENRRYEGRSFITFRTSLCDEASMKALLLSRMKKALHKINYALARAKPDLPEASIRHPSGMSNFSRGVAISLTALKEPASPRAYPCLGKVFR
jgi:hypothetical protein